MRLRQFAAYMAVSCLVLSGLGVACTSIDSGESDDEATVSSGAGDSSAGAGAGGSANGTSAGGATQGSGASPSSGGAASAQGGSAVGGGGQGGSGQGGSGQQICSWSLYSNSCGTGMYCDAPACAAGICKPIGTIQDAKKAVVCGCDGANYWNSNIAAVFGMPVQAQTACATAAVCGTIANVQCPKPDQHCAKAVPNMQACTTVDKGGKCWGMPQVCGAKGSYRICDDKFCQSECAVIKSGKMYYLDTLTCK